MNRSARRAWFAVFVAAICGCDSPPTVSTATLPPSILLISIDSLRADGLGCYGNPRATSPHIDALAARGVLYENTIAAAPWTLVSHASLLTGLFPREHGIHANLNTLDPACPLLIEPFRKAGYRTGAIVSGPFMAREYGLARGFDDYDDAIARMSEEESHRAVTSPRLADKAIAWMRRHAKTGGGKPFFLFLHLWDVHYDYISPPPFDRRFDPDYRGKVTGQFKPWYGDFGPPRGLAMPQRDRDHVRALYDGEVAFTDSHVGRVLDALAELRLAGSTIVCVTGDHGDEFYEHGQGGHLRTLYDEVLRVPWIMAGPGIEGPRRVREAVGNVDILPTLLDVAEVRRIASNVSGISQKSPHARPLFAETHYHWMKPACDEKNNEGALAAVRFDGWKLITRTSPPTFEQLFDLSRDATEQRDALGENKERAEELRRLLRRYLDAAPRYQPGVMREKSVISRLKTLGYLNGATPATASLPTTRP